MCSRLREKPEKLFEVFLEIAKPSGDEQDIVLIQKYPPNYDDENVLKDAPKFAFPCDTERYTTTVDHFTFVLTDLDSKYTFGFCRHATGAQTCLCIVSYLPWFEIFYTILNTLAEVINRSDDNNVDLLLREAYCQSVPAAGIPVTIVAQQEMLSFTAPDANKLPKIPESRNITEYYNAIDSYNMMQIFANLLVERRIIVTSKKLSRLTACVHASVSLLYPMHWQHLYIPILPLYLLDYVTAPMPFVIGIHSTLMEKVLKMEIGDAVILDADNNTITSEYDDFECLPHEVGSYLKRHLKGEKLRTNMMTSADAISKTFLMALVKLIGGYRDALRFQPGEEITFDPEAFVQSRPQSMQPCLESMLHLQLFQQFINGRLDMLNSGIGFSDIFETEATLHADKLNTQSRYKEWLGNMRKQGKKLQRGGKDVWSDFKDKAAPVMTNAMQSVKSHGKKAYSGFRARIGELRKDDDAVRSKSVKESPSSKNISRNRPSTIIGQELKPHRPPRPVQASPTSPKSPGLDSRERISRYKLIEEKSLDDNDIPYNRVSINLLNDPDIQFAINKSASAEDIVHAHKQDAFLIDSDESDDSSSGTGTPPITFGSTSALTSGGRNTPSGTSSGRDTPTVTPGGANKSALPSSGRNTPSSSRTSPVPNTKTATDKRNVVISDNLRDIPFMDLVTPAGESKPRIPDSSIKIDRPVAPPRKNRSPKPTEVPDRLIVNLTPAKAPKPTPRRSLSKESSMESHKPLIRLSSELEETFDPFASGNSKTVSQLDFLSQLENTPVKNSMDEFDNSSGINRTPAFKKGQLETPKRNNVKPDLSPLSDDSFQSTDNIKGVFDFDPLASSLQQGYHGNQKGNGAQLKSSNDKELLHSWNQHLSSPSNISNTSGSSWSNSPQQSRTSQSNLKEISPQVNASNPNYFPVLSPKNKTPPMVPSRPTSQSVDEYKRTSLGSDNPFASIGQSHVGFNSSSGGMFSSSGGGILQPQNLVREKTEKDPFADLVSIPKTGTRSPSPQKQKWETFE